MTTPRPKSIAIIGAGPVGLAAAAHALERGLDPIVFEAGPESGHAVRQWSHVRMFSPWEYNIDKVSARLLAATGWRSPDPKLYPTGSELVAAYLGPLAARTVLASVIRTSSQVTAISRTGFDKVRTNGRQSAPFEVRYRDGNGSKILLADAVIDASGTWSSPNPAGGNGVVALGEDEAQTCIDYGMPDVLGADRSRYEGQRVAVLGAGHSALGALIDLVALADASPGTHVVWLIRGDDPSKAFGGGASDQLAARGALGTTMARLVADGRVAVETNFVVTHLDQSEQGLCIVGAAGSDRHVVADRLIVATGFRPDFAFARELRLALDPALECPAALAPLIDPNEHSCGTVRPHGARELAQPEPGFYIAGMKSYGRAPTFLMLTGYEQVRSIVADIAGDTKAAARVELELPETGVCRGPSIADIASGCRGGPPKSDATACCVDDATAKSQGAGGCGRPTVARASRKSACCG